MREIDKKRKEFEEAIRRFGQLCPLTVKPNYETPEKVYLQALKRLKKKKVVVLKEEDG